MPSTYNFFSAVVLAALLLCASGAPIENESAAGDPSGDESQEVEKSSVRHFDKWGSVIKSTQHYQKAFEDEFQHIENQEKVLEPYSSPSTPAKCNTTNFRKEICLQRLAHGLLIYSVLLKHAEKEYPSSVNFSEAQSNIGNLIDLATMVKQKMRNSGQVTAPTSSEEERLLQEVNSPYAFHRKMRAHSILKHLNQFLIEGKRAICRMELKIVAGIRPQSGDINC